MLALKLDSMPLLLCFVLLLSAATGTGAQPTNAQPATERVLRACADNRADTLPNPFRDVSPRHWAYKAVVSLHYCGAYRGAIPPERFGSRTRISQAGT